MKAPEASGKHPRAAASAPEDTSFFFLLQEVGPIMSSIFSIQMHSMHWHDSLEHIHQTCIWYVSGARIRILELLVGTQEALQFFDFLLA